MDPGPGGDRPLAEVGIGALFTIADGVPSLVVTQLFASPPERIDPTAARSALTERLNVARRDKGLKPFDRHPWLDARAAEALGSCGAAALSYAAKAEKAPPFRLLRTVLVEGGTLDLILDSFVASAPFSSANLTHIGVAVARAEGGQGGGCAVVFFAAKK